MAKSLSELEPTTDTPRDYATIVEEKKKFVMRQGAMPIWVWLIVFAVVALMNLYLIPAVTGRQVTEDAWVLAALMLGFPFMLDIGGRFLTFDE